MVAVALKKKRTTIRATVPRCCSLSPMSPTHSDPSGPTARSSAAGAFHNDVVAVANERVLFAHELAFEDKGSLYTDIATKAPWAEIVEEIRTTTADRGAADSAGEREAGSAAR